MTKVHTCHSAIKVESLLKSFSGGLFKPDFCAVNRVSLSVEQGEVYGLVGPNGSGKSTLMKAVLGLCAPTQGACYVFGRNSLAHDSRQEIGYLPENPYFYKYLTGHETLEFYGQLSNIPRAQLKSRVEEVLHKVSLYEVRERKVRTYSKGMLQRIGIAQAIIHDPKLLILDEPTAGVDPVGCYEIKELIQTFQSEGKTVFLCSHLLEHVSMICDRVGLMDKGELKSEGVLSELLEDSDQQVLVTRGTELSHANLREFAEGLGGLEVLSHERRKRSLEEFFLRSTQ